MSVVPACSYTPMDVPDYVNPKTLEFMWRKTWSIPANITASLPVMWNMTYIALVEGASTTPVGWLKFRGVAWPTTPDTVKAIPWDFQHLVLRKDDYAHLYATTWAFEGCLRAMAADAAGVVGDEDPKANDLD